MAKVDDDPVGSVRRDGVRERGFATAGLVGLSALVSAWIGRVSILETFIVWPVAGLSLVAALTVGTVGIAAITVGYLVAAVGFGTPDPIIGFAAGSLFLFGYVAAFLWRRQMFLPVVGYRITPDPIRLLVSIGVASIAAGAAMAWGGEVTGRAPFFVGPRYAVAYALVGLLIGLPLWAGVLWLRTTRGGSTMDGTPLDRPGRSLAVAAISVWWLLAGSLWSIGYRSVGTIRAGFPYTFERRGLEGLLVLRDNALFGVGGARALAVFGGIMVSLLLWAFLEDAADRQNVNAGERA